MFFFRIDHILVVTSILLVVIFCPDILLMKNFKYFGKLKAFWSEHLCTPNLVSTIKSLLINLFQLFFFFTSLAKFYYLNFALYSFYSLRMFGLFSVFVYDEAFCNKHCCIIFVVHLHSLLKCVYLGVELLAYRISAYVDLVYIAKGFPKWLY